MRSLTAVGCGRGRGAGTRGIATGAHFGWLPTIASAVYSGHKLGRELDLTVDDPALNIRREVTALSDDYPSTGPNLWC